ncbi:uncharacterized protein LOC8268654 [Ricinus communis]|jgi:hypothetical protein|nr:uncharacterized protein LOC8268654 [Ricinus communis]
MVVSKDFIILFYLGVMIHTLLAKEATGKYISNGVMKSNEKRGCSPLHPVECKHQQANKWQRGCGKGEKCREPGSRPVDTNTLHEKRKNNEKFQDDKMKEGISNGALGKNKMPVCSIVNQKHCRKQQANDWQRGCQKGHKCRGDEDEEGKDKDAKLVGKKGLGLRRAGSHFLKHSQN